MSTRKSLDWPTLEAALRLVHRMRGRLALTHDQRALIPSDVASYFEPHWVPLELATYEPHDREWRVIKRGPNYSLERLDSRFSYQQAQARAPHFYDALCFAHTLLGEMDRTYEVKV